MISLHVYLKTEAEKAEMLQAAIQDTWLQAMSEQPGFVSAAILTPFPDDALADLEAVRPEHTFEVVSFWRSEKERLAWVARPIHDQVFIPVMDLAASVSFTVQTVAREWNL